jgi:hypothetical protein
MVSRDPSVLRASAAREELALGLCSDESNPFRAASSYTRLGAARALLDDRVGARAALEKATTISPRFALPVAWLAYLTLREGDRDLAATLLKKAVIDLGPPDVNVVAVVQIFRQANSI